MKHSKKIAIIVSVVCILAGIGMILAGCLGMADQDPRSFSTIQFKEKSYKFSEPISNIDIQTTDSNIKVVPSENSHCRIICDDNEKRYHEVTLENGTLTITQKNDYMWYETMGVYWYYDPTITIYLPEAEYADLKLISVSGDVHVSPGFSFQTAKMQSTSGSLVFSSSAVGMLRTATTSGAINLSDFTAGRLEISTSSGDILIHSGEVGEAIVLEAVSGHAELNNISAQSMTARTSSGIVTLRQLSLTDELALKTVSGDMELEDLSVKALSANTSSGVISLRRTSAADEFLLKSVSGRIRLDGSDASALQIETSSGDVEGTLRTPKNFIYKTSSGNVSLPASDFNAGICEITTISGDIALEIQP